MIDFRNNLLKGAFPMLRPTTERAQTHKRVFFLLLAMLFFAVVFLRVDGIATRELEYDEIWTLENFLGKPCALLLNDFSSTNNHPLHSILTKGAHAAIHDGLPSLYPDLGYLSIRIAPLISGILLLVFCVFAVRAERRSGWLPPAIFITILCGWNTQLIHYSSTSRGYSMQCLFVFLMTTALLRLGDPAETRRIRFSLLAVLSALAAIFTIPNAAVFAAAAALAWLAVFCDWKRPWKTPAFLPLLAFGAAAAVPALLWLIANSGALNEARAVFSESAASPTSFLHFSGRAILCSGLLLPFLILLPGLASGDRRMRRIAAFLLIFAALSLFSCVFTGIWGEERIFLPLAAPLSLGAALNLGRLCERRTIGVFFACFAGLLALCTILHVLLMRILIPMPWEDTAQLIRTELPFETYAIYPPAHGYAISFNHESLKEDHMRRLLAPTDSILSFAQEGELEGVDTDRYFQTVAHWDGLRSAFQSGDDAPHPFRIYRIRPLRADDDLAERPLFAKLTPVPTNERDRLREKLRDDAPVLLNLFFNAPLVIDGENEPRMGFFEVLTKPQRSAACYLEMREGSENALFFYVPEDGAEHEGEPRSFVRQSSSQ